MKIKLLDPNCMPEKFYQDDAGFDLKISQSVTLQPFETKVVGTGICVEIPKGYSGDIRPRSSTSKKGILIHYGTVDCGYTGEVKVIITNLNNYPVTLQQHQRIAQLVINKICNSIELQFVEELTETERGDNGLGSTKDM